MTQRTVLTLTTLLVASCAAEGSERLELTAADFPDAVVFDSFSESGIQPLTSHVPDVGAGWENVFDSTDPGDHAVADNGVVRTNISRNHTGMAYQALPAPTDSHQRIGVTLVALDSTSGTKPVGVFGRRIDNDNLYLLQVLPHAHSKSSLQLYLRRDGELVLLAEADPRLQPGDRLVLELGTEKRVLLNDQVVLRSDDDTLDVAGSWGLFFGGYGFSGHIRTSWRLDDFLAEPLDNSGAGSSVICGDAVCESGEDCSSCAEDCGACEVPASCGDGVCDSASEDCSSCAEDCGACEEEEEEEAPSCGDGVCDGAEDCGSCEEDCGRCSVPAPTPSEGLWLSPSELMALPMSGAGWRAVESTARGSWGSADVANQDNDHDVKTFAGALYAARTGDAGVRRRVEEALEAAVGTEAGGRTLALGRNLVAYVLAADLIGYRSSRFESWVSSVRTRSLGGRAGIDTIYESAVRDPSNWGCHARASMIAAALYLGDRDQLDELAGRLHDYTGRSGSGFEFKELWWQADRSNPVGINPAGATINGHPVGGVIPDDQRRAGEFSWPPPRENYVWESLQGTVVAAELLHRAGYDAYSWEDQAILRAVRWLHDEANFPAGGDDQFTPWLVNAAYGTSFPAATAPGYGKNMGFTDWTHGS